MKYRWRDLSFDIDDSIDDRTLVVLAQPGKGQDLAYSLVVSEDKTPSGFAAYVDEVLREQAVSLSGFRITSRTAATALDRKAVVVDAVTLSPHGAPQLQKQAFVDRGGAGGVVVVTGSCRDDADSAARLATAFGRVLTSLSRDSA